MPTYEYKCRSCGHVFEAFQKITDAPLTKCPECGGELYRVIYGGSGVIFKGSGWYVTDYGKGRSSATPGANAEKQAKKDIAKEKPKEKPKAKEE